MLCDEMIEICADGLLTSLVVDIKRYFIMNIKDLNQGPSDCRVVRLWIFNVKDGGVVSSSGPVKDVVILSKHTQSHVAAMHQLRHTNVKCPCDRRTHT